MTKTNKLIKETKCNKATSVLLVVMYYLLNFALTVSATYITLVWVIEKAMQQRGYYDIGGEVLIAGLVGLTVYGCIELLVWKEETKPAKRKAKGC